MFEILPVNEEKVLAFRASGKLTDEDYKSFLPTLESLIRENGVISLYIELEDFEGWDSGAVWDDLRFGLQHDKDFKRIAVVGEGALEHWGTALANFFTRTEMRFFRKSEADKAWDWLKEAAVPEDRARPVTSYRKILLVTDFSIGSERAAYRARELCAQYGARLHVLHIVEPMVFYYDEYNPIIADIPQQDEALFIRAEESMQEFARRTELGKDVDLEVQWGTPRRSIISWAREKDVDLIVAGSHGRHGIERLLGSVSSGILNRAHCDVLVVKP